MARLPRWMYIESERVSEDRKSLELTIRLKWWRYLDPSFWWAVLRG